MKTKPTQSTSSRIRPLLLTAVLCGLALPAALAAPPTDGEVNKLIDEFRAKARGANIETIKTNAIELFKGIKPAELSVDQLEKLSNSGLLRFQTPEVRVAILARLEQVGKDSGADGAAALALAVSMASMGGEEEEPRRNALLVAVAKHPGLQAAFKAERLSSLFSSISYIDTAPFAKDGVMTTFSRLITADLPVQQLLSVLGFARNALVQPVTDIQGQDRTRLRETILNLLDRAITSETNANRIDYYKRSKDLFNGAAALGELVGKPAPKIDFFWSNRKPEPKSFADFKGKVVLIDFWATWCGPCIGAFPHMREMKQRYADSPVELLGVTSIQGMHNNPKATDPKTRRISTEGDEKKETGLMNDFIRDMEITWTIVFSRENAFNPDFGVGGIPHLAILDAQGRVRYNAKSPYDDDIEEKIDGLLREAGAKVPPPRKKEEKPADAKS